MKKNLFIAALQVIGILLLFFNGWAQETTNTNLETARKEIAGSNALYFQAFAKGDSSLLIDRYTKDCWIMPANAPALCGVDAPLELYKMAYYKAGLRNGKFITIDVFGDAVEYVTEVGFWRTFDANNRVINDGKFLVLWKKTPNGWKMFRDSFSSDRDK